MTLSGGTGASMMSVPGQVIKTRDAGTAAVEAAAQMASTLRDAVEQRGCANLGLSGGSTPYTAYALLARDARVDWSLVRVFWVDERAVPPTSDRNNYRAAKAALLDPAGLRPDNVFRMPAERSDLGAVAKEYEQSILKHVALDLEGVPSFDLLVLGMGDDGHTASIFPGDPTVATKDRFVAAVPANGAREARVTMTPPLLEHARVLLALIVGANKRKALERVWSDQGSLQETPARVLRGCRGRLVWVVDDAASVP